MRLVNKSTRNTTSESNLVPLWGDYRTVRALFDLGQIYLYELWHAGKVESKLIRKDNKKRSRGRRLFNIASIHRFIESCDDPEDRSLSPHDYRKNVKGS
jgi:hypothetical protein